MAKEKTVEELTASVAALEAKNEALASENAKLKADLEQVINDSVEAQQKFESSLAVMQNQTAGLSKQFELDGKLYKINAKSVEIDGKLITDADIAGSNELQLSCIANGYGFIEQITK